MRHAAPNTHLFFDAALDLFDERVVRAAAQHIGIALQVAALLAHRAEALFLYELRAVDARRLSLRRPLVVKNAALAHEQLRELFKRLSRETLAVPVHLVVAQPHGKGVDLVRLQLTFGKSVDGGKLLVRHHAVFEP